MCENGFHGKLVVRGNSRFELPRENFMIEPLPNGGPYSLVIDSIRGGNSIPKAIATINANEWTKVKGLTPGTLIYIDGVRNSIEFAVRW